MRSRKPRAATRWVSSVPKSNCPATPPCADRAIDTSLSASRLPPVRPAQSGCRPCSLHSAVYASAISALPGVWMPPSWWVRAAPSAPLPCVLRPCSGRCRRDILPWQPVTGILPVPTYPVLQRLGTATGAALLGGAWTGACLAPVVIRCRFRSTVAVPIPFTRARSSTRSKGPCCRRYATIASAFIGPTFASPCCSVDASAVLMSIRSAARAVPLNNSPSTSALHENQGPTVQLLVARNRPLPAILSKAPASLATYTQPIVHDAFTQQA